ncbi:MAG: hypothetical protein RL266_2025 [Bacteroidota bacterium]|jgi:hypothetical protein
MATQVSAQSIAPDVVASAGTHFSNGASQLSWTIGETVISTHDNGTNILTQGFHQPLLTVTGIEESSTQLGGVNVYPNPSSYQLNIRFNDFQSKVVADVYDAIGQLVLSEQIAPATSQYQLDLTGISNGSYILRLTSLDGLQTSFNIQKVQP